MVALALLGSLSSANLCRRPAFAESSSVKGSQTPKTDLRFTEVASQSGITFKHVLSAEKKYIVESMSGGVALFDYDNDGYLDIYFVNSLTVDLVRYTKPAEVISTTTIVMEPLRT